MACQNCITYDRHPVAWHSFIPFRCLASLIRSYKNACRCVCVCVRLSACVCVRACVCVPRLITAPVHPKNSIPLRFPTPPLIICVDRLCSALLLIVKHNVYVRRQPPLPPTPIPSIHYPFAKTKTKTEHRNRCCNPHLHSICVLRSAFCGCSQYLCLLICLQVFVGTTHDTATDSSHRNPGCKLGGNLFASHLAFCDGDQRYTYF